MWNEQQHPRDSDGRFIDSSHVIARIEDAMRKHAVDGKGDAQQSGWMLPDGSVVPNTSLSRYALTHAEQAQAYAGMFGADLTNVFESRGLYAPLMEKLGWIRLVHDLAILDSPQKMALMIGRRPSAAQLRALKRFYPHPIVYEHRYRDPATGKLEYVQGRGHESLAAIEDAQPPKRHVTNIRDFLAEARRPSIELADRLAPDWALEPMPKPKFDRNAVELPRYASIERSFSGTVQILVRRFLDGAITEPQLVREFSSALREAETDTFVAGRRARGVLQAEVTPAEIQMLDGRHNRNVGYFRNFVQDMKQGAGRMDYHTRASLYAKSLWSLYTRGESVDWDRQQHENARYYWIMDPDAEHCIDCLNRARMSRDNDGFTWEQLVELGFPGEGTRCMVNCRCHIQTVAKRTMLPERVAALGPAKDPIDGINTLIEALGGPQMPIRMPAAGLSTVRLTPGAVHDSIAIASEEAAPQLARLLPLVPAILQRPAAVVPSGDARVFIGNGLAITLGRDSDNGLWSILAIVLADTVPKIKLSECCYA